MSLMDDNLIDLQGREIFSTNCLNYFQTFETLKTIFSFYNSCY